MMSNLVPWVLFLKETVRLPVVSGQCPNFTSKAKLEAWQRVIAGFWFRRRSEMRYSADDLPSLSDISTVLQHKWSNFVPNLHNPGTKEMI